MVIKYILLFTLILVILGSVVPIFQFIKYKKNLKSQYVYVFDQELLNCHIESSSTNNQVSRYHLNNRGWIRGPQGHIMDEKDFEKKKNDEYNIQLP